MTKDDKTLIQELKNKLTNIEYQIEQKTRIDLPSVAYIALAFVAVHLVLRFVGVV